MSYMRRRMIGGTALFLLSTALWSAITAHPGHEHDPPKIPERFSVRAELVDSVQNEIHSFTETIDFEAKFLRRDFVPSQAKIFSRYRRFGERPLVIIDDFATGHEFVIDSWRSNCTLTNISSQANYDFSDKQDPFGMRRVLRFLIGPDFQYVKSDTVRGIPVDVFKREMNNTVLMKYFILQHGWHALSDQFRQKMFSVPVALDYGRYDNKTGKFVSQRTHLYDFTTDHTDLASLRMEDCFKHNSFKKIEIKFKGEQPMNLGTNLNVRYAMLKKLSTVMTVSMARISRLNFLVNRSGASVTFSLYEPITATSYLPKPPVQTSVDDAIKKLRESVNSGLAVVVSDYADPVMLETVEVIQGSRDNTVKPSPRPLTKPPETSQAGVIAGVGITLLVVGLAAGFGIAFFFRKRFPCDKSVPYAQTD